MVGLSPSNRPSAQDTELGLAAAWRPGATSTQRPIATARHLIQGRGASPAVVRDHPFRPSRGPEEPLARAADAWPSRL